MLSAFIHGFILAFSLIIPLGIQNVFIFSQGVTQPRFRRVIPLVVVAGFCDTLLILLAVLGVSLAVLTIAWVKTILILSGFCFLLVIAWTNWRDSFKTTASSFDGPNSSLKSQILFTFSVSLLNPHAILDTIGVIGTTSLSYNGRAKLAFCLACIAVSWLWFLMLALAGRILGSIYPYQKIQRFLNRSAAVIILICAFYLLTLLFK